ncbi:GDSL esterase/lipase [Nymphaea thermarum]|nr:GDSL esterase/lipase [Nymphaea thermarum]
MLHSKLALSMASAKFLYLVLLPALSLLVPTTGEVDLNFPAIFNFGDSNSDTGNLVAAMGEKLVPPNGETFFKSPAGRFCDERLIVDFLYCNHTAVKFPNS